MGIKAGQIWKNKITNKQVKIFWCNPEVQAITYVDDDDISRVDFIHSFLERFEFVSGQGVTVDRIDGNHAQYWVKSDSLPAGLKADTRECPKCGIEYIGLESLLIQTNKMCQICRSQEKIRNEIKSHSAQALRQAVSESIQKKSISWNDRWPESFWTEKGDKAKGVKSDNNKRRYSLLPAGTINEVVDVLEFGSAKYADDNWQKVDNARTRYYNAALRHIDSWWDGEVKDDETGKHHLAHAICCLMFLMWFDLSAHKNTEKGK